jgi:hypothetical protein
VTVSRPEAGFNRAAEWQALFTVGASNVEPVADIVDIASGESRYSTEVSRPHRAADDRSSAQIVLPGHKRVGGGNGSLTPFPPLFGELDLPGGSAALMDRNAEPIRTAKDQTTRR